MTMQVDGCSVEVIVIYWNYILKEVIRVDLVLESLATIWLRLVFLSAV
jgi:hypothetical protein